MLAQSVGSAIAGAEELNPNGEELQPRALVADESTGQAGAPRFTTCCKGGVPTFQRQAMPPYAPANDLWAGPVPPELRDLVQTVRTSVPAPAMRSRSSAAHLPAKARSTHQRARR